MGWKALINPVAALLSEFIEDKDQVNRLAHEISTLAEKNSHEESMAQIEVNKQEAAHKSLFVAGWRPFIGWTCGIATANNFVIAPYVTAFTTIVVPVLDLGEMIPVLVGLLGLGAYRTYEKVNGVAREK